MSKRFIDTNLWEKPWFRKLSPVEKSAWLYILTKCDNVGVWIPDLELGDFSIGDSVDWEGFKDRANGNIEVLPNGKWYLVNYVNFQHVDLLNGSKSNACISYLKLLQHHDVLDRFEGLALDSSSSSLGGKVKVRVKVQAKEQEKKVAHGDIVMLKPSNYQKLIDGFGKREADSKLQDIDLWCLANGKTKKNYYATALNWFKRDGVLPDKNEYKECPKGHRYKGDFCEECV